MTSSSSSINTAGFDSPTKATALVSSTPWKQIVAGFGDADPIEEKADNKAADEEAFMYSTVDGSKKPVWNKQSSEPLESIEPVMGADSWPALSDIAKAPQKSSVESPKSVSEPSVPLSRGNGQSPSAQKQVTNNPHPNSSLNHANPVRQKSFKRQGGHASGSNGNSTQPLQPPSSGQSATALSNPNTSSSQKNISLESGQKFQPESLSHGTNDRPRHFNPHRKVNGNHHHGDVNNHRTGARRDHDRPNLDWNSQRSFNGRDVHPQGTGVFPRGIVSNIPMPHDSAPFIAPPLSPVMRPYVPTFSYPEFPFYYVPVPPESIQGMSIAYPAPAPPHLFMQYPDPELCLKIIYQIDYYFSNDNLIKDIFLRKNMDEGGWVPIKLIAGFKKVKTLTDNIALITEAIRTSTVVEVKDDKVRKRNDWMKWLMPEPLRIPSQSTHLDSGSSSEFVAGIHKLNINGENAGIPNATPPPSQHPSH